MKLLLGTPGWRWKMYGGWKMYGLLGKNALWFFGFTRSVSWVTGESIDIDPEKLTDEQKKY